MKTIIISFTLIFQMSIAHATLNQSTWKPPRNSSCSAGKFKCAKTQRCIRHPRESRCEVIRLSIRGVPSYVNYCKNYGSTCSGSYSSCSGLSVGGTQNPYATCAP